MLRKLLGGRWSGTAGDPVETALGTLERAVMDVLWREADLAVRDVQERLGRQIAYTTVMTTLNTMTPPLSSTGPLKASSRGRGTRTATR